MLSQAGGNVALLRERLGEALDRLPKVTGQAGQVNLGNELARLLNVTDKLAAQRGDAFIASELFITACIEDAGAVVACSKTPVLTRHELKPPFKKCAGARKCRARMRKTSGRLWRSFAST